MWRSNSNKFLISYLSDLAHKNNIEIRINFPVTGHSFMPIDRSFGRVKKLIKRKDPIISINEYYLLFSEVGKVWKYREDFVFSDWKLFLKNIKINKGVQIRNLRQIKFFETSIQYYYKANKITGIVQSCVSELGSDVMIYMNFAYIDVFWAKTHIHICKSHEHISMCVLVQHISIYDTFHYLCIVNSQAYIYTRLFNFLIYIRIDSI